jgi:hypothetical protein
MPMASSTDSRRIEAMAEGSFALSSDAAIAASASRSRLRRLSSRSFRDENTAVPKATNQNAMTLNTASWRTPAPVAVAPDPPSRIPPACAEASERKRRESHRATLRPVR